MTLTQTVPTSLNFPQPKQFERRAHIPLKIDYLWQIQSGIVRTLTWLEDGTIITLGLWGPGDLISPLLASANPYQIECLTPVEVIPLVTLNSPQMNKALMQQLRTDQEFLQILRTRPIDVAVVRLLYWIGRRFGREIEKGQNKGQLIEIRLTHQEIAEILGTTRVTVTRIFSELERRGTIERLPRQLIIFREEIRDWHYQI